MQGDHKVGYLRSQDGWRKGAGNAGKRKAKLAAKKPSTKPSTVAKTTSTKKFNRGPTMYVAQKGDTLWSIAKKNGMDVKTLKELNGLKGDAIQKGQTIKLS